MSGWWRKHQVGVTRKHRRWAERKRNHVSLMKGDYIGLQKNSRGNFGVSHEWRKHQNVSKGMPETGNKKETPCKDVYLKTAPRTPLSWVELEYTLHMALCSNSCVGVAAMARNRNKRRSPTSFLPHPGNPTQVCSLRCLISTQQKPQNATLS